MIPNQYRESSKQTIKKAPLSRGEISYFIDEIILEFEREPIDLLNISDAKGEAKYIQQMKHEYVTTIQDIVSQINLSEGSNVLEIGSFLGVVSIALSKLGYRIHATDILEFMSNTRLQKKLDKFNVSHTSVNLRSYNLPFEDKSFDAVVMCEVLEHLNFNPLPVILEINRVLKDQGVLYLALPNLASLRNRIKLVQGISIHNPIQHYFQQLDPNCNMIVGLHWREYTTAEIQEMLQRLGFRIQNQYYHTGANHAGFSLKTILQRIIYKVMPSLMEGQINVAIKTSDCNLDFAFTDATRPVF